MRHRTGHPAIQFAAFSPVSLYREKDRDGNYVDYHAAVSGKLHT
jgi:hypothetical protein